MDAGDGSQTPQVVSWETVVCSVEVHAVDDPAASQSENIQIIQQQPATYTVAGALPDAQGTTLIIQPVGQNDVHVIPATSKPDEELETYVIFQCDDCGKQFGTSKELESHEKTHHIQLTIRATGQHCCHCRRTIVVHERRLKMKNVIPHIRPVCTVEEALIMFGYSYPTDGNSVLCANCTGVLSKSILLKRQLDSALIEFRQLLSPETIASQEAGQAQKKEKVQKDSTSPEDHVTNQAVTANISSEEVQKETPSKSPSESEDPQKLTEQEVQTLKESALVICRKCDAIFHSTEALKAHAEVHSPKTGEKNTNKTAAKPSFRQKIIGRPKAQIGKRKGTQGMKKSLICNFCRTGYTDDQVFKKHVQAHKSPKPYSCNVCKEKFTILDVQIAHFKAHVDDKKFLCSDCKNRFPTTTLLRQHLQAHIGDRLIYCTVCHMGFIKQEKLDLHALSHMTPAEGDQGSDDADAGMDVDSDDDDAETRDERQDAKESDSSNKLQCYLCHKTFRQASILRRHLKTHENESEATGGQKEGTQTAEGKKQGKDATVSAIEVKTEGQEKEITGTPKVGEKKKREKETNGTPRGVIKEELGEKQCELCMDSFQDREAAKECRESHKHDAGFACGLCPKVLKNKYGLRNHRELHKREGVFLLDMDQCPVCHEKLDSVEQVEEHKEWHKGTGDNVKCHICGREFGQKGNLRRHLLTHSQGQEDPNTCSLCHIAFEDADKLKAHKEKHTGPSGGYSCHICGTELRKISQLRYHVRIHRKKNECLRCCEQFDTADELSIHKQATGDHSEEPLLSCSKCGKCYTEIGIHRHLQECGNEESYQCETCGKSFRDKHYFRKHVKRHDNPVECECEVCGKKLVSPHNLECHMRIHKGLKPFQCATCGRLFRQSGQLSRHKLTHLDSAEKKKIKAQAPVHVCEVCGKVFTEKTNLNKHRRIHNPAERPTYQCGICGKQFLSANSLSSHNLIHTGETPYACSFCPKRFRQKGNLVAHELRHRGLKRYQCTHCGKGFVHKDDCQRHMMIHNADAYKKFSCSNCGYTCMTMALLRQHTMIHTGEKRHTCDICNKGFIQKSSLEAHLRVHTGERPFGCNICGKSFSTANYLKKHERFHTSEKPHKCDLCNYSTYTRSGLKVHRMVHTTEKLFPCPLCGKGYNKSSHLKRHIAVHYKHDKKT